MPDATVNFLDEDAAPRPREKPGEMFVEVAVPLPVHGTFTYHVPPALVATLAPGYRVEVPFGKRRVTGVCVRRHADPTCARDNIKSITAVLDDEPVIHEQHLPYLTWLAAYYHAPLGQVLAAALPAGINQTSVRGVQLTAKGDAALTRPSELPRALYDALTPLRKGPLAEKKLSRVAPASGVRAAFSQGLVERTALLSRPAVRERTEEYFSPHPDVAESVAAAERRAPVRTALFRYIHDHGSLARTDIPKEFKAPGPLLKKMLADGWITARSERVYRDPHLGYLPGSAPPASLTPAQHAVVEDITAALDADSFHTFLLHGVTASGKTEVYLRAIEHVRRLNKGALLLVPEIALTPQLLGHLMHRFREDAAVLHSGLTPGERYDEWRRLHSGEASIGIGVRSAVFAPIENLGLIIVDEEHDASYKQEDGVPYHARDVALVRARDDNAVVILGSATPSLESFHNAQEGKYTLVTLPERVEHRPLPHVSVIDLRAYAGEKEANPMDRFITPPLRDAVRRTYEAGRQSILFLNRRGFTTLLVCAACGYRGDCPNCAIALTHHKSDRTLMCHSCDYRLAAPRVCPDCGGRIKEFGAGTQRIQELVARLVPGANVARLDSDVVRRKNALRDILTGLKDGAIDILVGTQMVAKGHDFPNVTLVGILLADAGLAMPDFRAAERTFMLLTQVAGRAGRGDDPGEVFLQTFLPDHYAITCALTHDYATFAHKESAFRRELRYPPFSRLVLFRLAGNTENGTARATDRIGAEAQAIVRHHTGVEVLGQAPAPLSKLRGKFRWNLMLRAFERKPLHAAADALRTRAIELTQKDAVTVRMDVDPLHLL